MVGFLFFLFLILTHLTDEHHIDDEDEAATFINDNIANAQAFIMDVAGNFCLKCHNTFY